MTNSGRQAGGLLSTALLIVALIFIARACDAVHHAASQAANQITQAQQQLQQAQSIEQQQSSTIQQELNSLTQTTTTPAQGSACTPTGGGTGMIVIEGPTAAHPGQADCVPQ